MVEEEDYNAVFSALSHPLRRNILSFIVEHGPQAYSELLSHFSLETGTLNYHLERMTNFLQQDDAGKYKATNIGYAARKILGSAKAELSNPHPPPSGGLGLFAGLHRFGESFFDALLLPEQAFQDAQSLAWPYAITGTIIVALYLGAHLYYGYYYSGVNGGLTSVLSGIITYALLVALFLASGYGIYRKRFSTMSIVACYSIAFLPLAIIVLLKLVTSPDLSQLVYFVGFLLFVWAAYLFLLAGRESFQLTMSQAFTFTAVGFVLFYILILLASTFRLFSLSLP